MEKYKLYSQRLCDVQEDAKFIVCTHEAKTNAAKQPK